MLVLHRLAVGVVVLEQLDPVVGGVLAEGHHDRARVVGADLLQHHVHAAEQRVHRPSSGPLDRARQAVVRAEQQRRGVDDEQRARLWAPARRHRRSIAFRR